MTGPDAEHTEATVQFFFWGEPKDPAQLREELNQAIKIGLYVCMNDKNSGWHISEIKQVYEL